MHVQKQERHVPEHPWPAEQEFKQAGVMSLGALEQAEARNRFHVKLDFAAGVKFHSNVFQTVSPGSTFNRWKRHHNNHNSHTDTAKQSRLAPALV